MKTTYLDNEIILLEGYKKDGTISHYQNRKLAEYKNIKQLLISGVVSTCCEPIGEGFFLGTTCPKCKRPFRQVLE